MLERAEFCHYLFSLHEMAEWVKQRFGWGTVYIVTKIMNEYGWRRARQVIKPIFTPAHMERRKQWSFKLLHFTSPLDKFGDSATCYIHLDEKWFYHFHLHRHMWLPKCKSRMDPNAIFRGSAKTQIPKIRDLPFLVQSTDLMAKLEFFLTYKKKTARYSLQVAVDKHKRDHRVDPLQLEVPQKPTQKIIKLVENAWGKWISEARIKKLFQDVVLVMKEIIRVGGNNNFEVPHEKVEKILL
tara:strand:+ start:628 stop:1347 length:720 start_codon:yes stop_codon:yes gene_type:complete